LPNPLALQAGYFFVMPYKKSRPVSGAARV